MGNEEPAPPSAPGTPPNGKLALLQTLASSGDSWVKIGTLALVAVSGAGNLFTTTQSGKETRSANRQEVEIVIRQIGEIHANQAEYLRNVARLEDTNRLARENQTSIAAIKANQEWLLRYIARKTGQDPPEF